MDYDKQFDNQMNAVLENKRTFSQMFEKNQFREVQLEMKGGEEFNQSCNTILKGNAAMSNGEKSGSSSMKNFTIGGNSEISNK